jgi:hypothetical protein
MLKNYTDFPDLKESIYYLKFDHFKKGLDPNCLINTEFYVDSFFNEISHEDEKTHILTFALKTIVENPGENNELFEYVKKSILELVKEKKIEHKYIEQMAFSSVNYYHVFTPVIEFFIENKLIGVNDLTEKGFSLVMCVENPKSIPKLMELGCDINIKLDNKDSEFNGMTAYDIAVKSKKKVMIKALQPYLSEEDFNNNFESKIKEFREEKNVRKQLALFRTALIENNLALVREIRDDQNFYKPLIEYNDKQDVNLINAAIRPGKVDFLNELIQFDYYQKNKTRLTHVGACHTEVAIYSGKNNLANILYDNGFMNANTLIKSFENRAINSKDIVNKLANDNYKLSPEILLFNYADEGASKIEFTKDELNTFFQKNEHYLHFEKIKVYAKMNVIPFKTIIDGYSYDSSHEVKNGTVKVLCNLLKQQELVDKENFEKNFTTLIRGIGYHDKKEGLRYSSLVLKIFLDKENEIYDKLSYFGARDWISQINKDNLEKLLLAYDDEAVEEKKKVKKLKI